MSQSGLLNSIGKQKQVLIKQREDWIECMPLLACCEAYNEYKIYDTGNDFNYQKEEIATVIETPEEGGKGMCCLYCCKQFREYQVKLQISTYSVSSSKREYKMGGSPFSGCWHFLDFCSPNLEVFLADNEKIGHINWPYSCICWPARGLCSCIELDVFDKDKNMIYQITAPCLNTGFLCGGTCGFLDPCSRREYKIIKPNQPDAQIGKIVNIYNGFTNECFNRADQFGIDFPDQADVNHKIILLHAAIFLDFLQYMA